MIPILWLCGAPGVGKSTVAWALYEGLVADGTAGAYVDIDQLGMCYPEARSDPGRFHLKARNLAGLVTGFEAAGAEAVVVSGVVDATGGSEFEHLGRGAVTLCLLRMEPDLLPDRLAARHGSAVASEDSLAEARLLDSTDFADLVVDTSRLNVAEVAGEVRGRLGRWPVPVDPLSDRLPEADPGSDHQAVGSVLWVCGSTGVGKSTVGFRLYRMILDTRRTAAFVDVDQIGFCSTAPRDHRLRSRNLASMGRVFASAGAEVLVVVGPVSSLAEASVYERALPGARFSWTRLHAGQRELTARIMSRQLGGTWRQPGDPMRGQSKERLLEIAADAVDEAKELQRSGPGRHIDTDGRTVEDVAELIFSSAW